MSSIWFFGYGGVRLQILMLHFCHVNLQYDNLYSILGSESLVVVSQKTVIAKLKVYGFDLDRYVYKKLDEQTLQCVSYLGFLHVMTLQLTMQFVQMSSVGLLKNKKKK